MNILAIETSCDETSAAVCRDGYEILSNVIASQDDIHAHYGGVVPELAARRHIEIIGQVANKALERASAGFEDMDILAVTQGPGLIGSLIVGISYMQGVSYRYGIPMVGINHIEGHLTAPLLGNQQVCYPVLGLIVSGGHTMLVKMDDVGKYTVIGRTLDDAAGEAFDKVATMMGLGYPGGPLVSKLAQKGDPNAIRFPRGLLRSQSFDFSFSGLKTAVLYKLKSESHPIPEQRQADIAASFEEAVADALVKKTLRAAKQYGIKTITAGGGVIRNARLRTRLEKQCCKHGYRLVLPEPILCTDNAGMIGTLAYYYRDRAMLAKDNAIDPIPSLKFVG
ncbi:MAG: tRNA (adenosine(37)-N6)-threonylcarbamoyltransferase complex transferase subunit TsaD [Candidatus Auribacterota bacterium]|jgi:N6-L-threonylcarbamoyladenine synthase|nr:tRNA (adenosine(37)-N6)-threonylcarbamoyltransferase complex transferase subunit TsaD [Candidatus Auribacterota bacterium]